MAVDFELPAKCRSEWQDLNPRPSSRTKCSAKCLSAIKGTRNLQRNLNDIGVRSFILTGAPCQKFIVDVPKVFPFFVPLTLSVGHSMFVI